MTVSANSFEPLLQSVLEETCSAEELEQFEQMIQEHAELRAVYLEQMRLHSMLQWKSGCVTQPVATTPMISTQEPTRKVGWRIGLSACGIALSLLFAIVLWHSNEWKSLVLTNASDNRVAVIVAMNEVSWEPGVVGLTVGDEIFHGSFAFSSGEVQLQFDSGVLVTLYGSTKLNIQNQKHLQLTKGRMTTKILTPGIRFVVESPTAEIIDFGTEFGVEVDPVIGTNVVVFDGSVDVTPRAVSNVSPTAITTTTRLVKGEGMSIQSSGQTSRLKHISREPFFNNWAVESWSVSGRDLSDSVIRGVWDNLTDTQSQKCYQIIPRGLKDGALAYVDREYQWKSLDGGRLPPFLRNADYVRTFNHDKREHQLELTIELSRAGELYVFMDDRSPSPDWLTHGFQDTSLDIAMDENEDKFASEQGVGKIPLRKFSIWVKQLPTGRFSLGSNAAKSMYGLAAVPKRIRLACVGDETTEHSQYPTFLQQMLGNKYEVLNFGIREATVSLQGKKPFIQSNEMQRIAASTPDVVFLMLGANDTLLPDQENEVLAQTWEQEYLKLIEKIAGLPNHPNVVICEPILIGEKAQTPNRVKTWKEKILPAIRRIAVVKSLPIIPLSAELQSGPNLSTLSSSQELSQFVGEQFFDRLEEVLPLTNNPFNLLGNSDAENGLQPWITRGGKLQITNTHQTSGKSAIEVTDRTANWHGPGQDVTALLQAHGDGYYELRASVFGLEPSEDQRVTMVFMVKYENEIRYFKTPPHPLTANRWTKFYDDVYIHSTGQMQNAILYLETNGQRIPDLITDDWSLSPLPPTQQK